MKRLYQDSMVTKEGGLHNFLNKTNVILLTIVLFIVLTINIENEFKYALFAVLIFWFLPQFKIYKYIKTLKSFKVIIPLSKRKLLFILPFLNLLVWFYGVIVGLINNNKIEFIIRNFAALVFFIMFYLLYKTKISKRYIYNFIYFTVYFVLIYNVLAYLNFKGIIRIGNFLFLNDFRSNGNNLLYQNQVLLFSLYTLSFYSFMNIKKTNLYYFFIDFFTIIMSSFAIIYINQLRGFQFGIIMLIIILTMLKLLSLVKLSLFKKWVFIFSVFLGVIAFFVVLYIYRYPVIYNMFTPDDYSNSIRYQQLTQVLSQSNFWGKGLGATFKYITVYEKYGYGIEITYLNIIHKFGIFALVLIFTIAYILYIIMNDLMTNNSRKSYLLFGLMGFIFPSIGNPFLITPETITMMSLILYLFYLEMVETV